MAARIAPHADIIDVVGPANGLLSWALTASGGAPRAVSLTSRRYGWIR